MILIWEGCYYEPASTIPRISRNQNPEFMFQDFNASLSCNLQSNIQTGDKVHLLVTKMLKDSHANIVGDGLVGRVASSGNYKWIQYENYYGEAHPPEVVKELCLQFSAGMKTVAVIPILPLGVVQFGSHLWIMESTSFVNCVMSLILQLGNAPGILLSDDYASAKLAPKIGSSLYLGNSASGDLSLESNTIHVSSSAGHQPSYSLAGVVQNDLQSTAAAFLTSDSSQSHIKLDAYNHEAKGASSNPLMNGVVKGELIPLKKDIWRSQQASLYIPRSTLDLPCSHSSSLNDGSIGGTEQKFLFDIGNQGRFSGFSVSCGNMMAPVRTNCGLISSSDEAFVTLLPAEVKGLRKGVLQNVKTMSGTDSVLHANKTVKGNIVCDLSSSNEPRNVNLSKVEGSFFDSVDKLNTNSFLGNSSGSQYHHLDKKFAKNEVFSCSTKLEELSITQAQDTPLLLRNELLNIAAVLPSFVEDGRKHEYEGQSHSVNNTKYNDPYVQPQSGDDLFDILGVDFKNKLFNRDTNNFSSTESLASSEICGTSHGNSDCIFTTDNDHLLDVVVSKVRPTVKQSMNDIVSSRTTLTNVSNSSATNVSLPYGHFGVSDQMKRELFCVPKYLAKTVPISSCLSRPGSSKEDLETYSQSSSLYGSQISSWTDKGHNPKQINSVFNGCCKKQDEISKTNRKRLRPGENPRPRPKDRQMIQDRVKELRELVPNGAKCSIDSLLERTIKHMLFLRSVTKHADDLRQAGESKLIGKDDSLPSQDNFGGGATWAYEIGLQSMVCPIIVEDLNQPRRMLVEMLCEERGLFLEIADIIRGLELTILKGIMETRNDKIWARFAVEANRDVTRMEIFISLVRLLEQSAKSGLPQTNISNVNTLSRHCH